jgi:hypothetical protein
MQSDRMAFAFRRNMTESLQPARKIAIECIKYVFALAFSKKD